MHISPISQFLFGLNFRVALQTILESYHFVESHLHTALVQLEQILIIESEFSYFL